LTLVRSLDQLLLLPRDPRVNGFGPRSPVRIGISGLSPPERVRAERALNRLQSRCGCVAGGVTSLAAVTLGIAHVYWQAPPLLGWATVRQMIVVLALSIAAGLLAKLMTLLVIRVEFERECRVQHKLLSRLVAATTV
jgi:hypothetical protein